MRIQPVPEQLPETPCELYVPFHRAPVGEDEVRAVSDVIRSGWMTMGPKTFEFENQFARFVGAEHAIAVSTGTAALHLALEAAGIHSGDEVLVPTTTFTASAEAVIYTGARPVLVDVDSVTMNIDPEDAARRITPKTKAIIPVHLAGQPCDMEEIHDLAQVHHLRVIEDAAHALPSQYQGRRVGQLSEFTCFSFYATKTLTTGEGGMITTNNASAAERMRLMRLHGIERDAWKRYGKGGSWSYQILEAGFKYNFTDFQAAMGLLKLDRDAFIEALLHRGVACSVHFIPLHLQPFYCRAYGYRPGDFPGAEKEYRSCLSLPIYPGMTEKEINHVITVVLDTTRESRIDSRITADASPTA